jgi:hypothetical protein
MGADLEQIHEELVNIVKRLYDCARGLRRLQWQRQADVETYELHEATLIDVIVRRLGINLDEIAGELVDRTDEQDQQVYRKLREKLEADLFTIEAEEETEIERITRLFRESVQSYNGSNGHPTPGRLAW